MIHFYGKVLLAPHQTPPSWRSTPCGCPQLLIQYIHSYPPHWRPFLHPQPEDTPYHLTHTNINPSCYSVTKCWEEKRNIRQIQVRLESKFLHQVLYTLNKHNAFNPNVSQRSS